MKRSTIINYSLLLMVMVIWGSNVIIFKVLVEHIEPASMTSVRNLIGSIVLMQFLIKSPTFFKLTKKEWMYTLVASFTGIAGHHLLMAEGLITTTASTSAVILALSPTATAVFSYLFLKVKLIKIQLIGIFISFASVFLLVSYTDSKFSLTNFGFIYVFLSMLLQAFSYIFIRKATYTIEPKRLTALMLFIGSLFLFVYSFIFEPSGIKNLFLLNDYYVWGLLIFSAVTSSAIGQMLYNSSIQKVGANNTAIFSNLIPFFSMVFSVIFLKEVITCYQIILFVFVVLGVLLCIGFNENKPKRIRVANK